MQSRAVWRNDWGESASDDAVLSIKEIVDQALDRSPSSISRYDTNKLTRFELKWYWCSHAASHRHDDQRELWILGA